MLIQVVSYEFFGMHNRWARGEPNNLLLFTTIHWRSDVLASPIDGITDGNNNVRNLYVKDLRQSVIVCWALKMFARFSLYYVTHVRLG